MILEKYYFLKSSEIWFIPLLVCRPRLSWMELCSCIGADRLHGLSHVLAVVTQLIIFADDAIIPYVLKLVSVISLSRDTTFDPS